MIPAGGIYLTLPEEKKEEQHRTRSALIIGDDGTTAIIDVSRLIDNTLSSTAKSGWYDLNGRRLPAKPTTKGVYIINGNKVAIK